MEAEPEPEPIKVPIYAEPRIVQIVRIMIATEHDDFCDGLPLPKDYDG